MLICFNSSRLSLSGLALMLALVVGTVSDTRAADSLDRRFLAGLRERQLFRLAETYCNDRLADSGLLESQRAELVVELSLTLAGRAVHSPRDQRPPLWQRAWQVTQEWAERFPDGSPTLLVRQQGALVLLDRGELARQESQLVADNGRLVEEALTNLREAIRQLDTLTVDVAARLGQQSLPGRSTPRPLDDGELTAYQLGSFEKNLQYQLARAYRNQGQVYAAASPDRAHALAQAARLLDPLAKLDPSHVLAWKSRVDEVVCHRLLEDFATAAGQLEALLAAEPPPSIVLRASAERLRLAMAAGQPVDSALRQIPTRQIDRVTSAELDYALLETYLAAWRSDERSGQTPQADEFQQKATEAVRLIEREHGPYWTRRAEMLLAGYVQTSSSGADLAMQTNAAEGLFRSGQIDDALAAYDRAQALAIEEGDQTGAFQLGYTAATIEHQRDRHAEALARYRGLALGMPNQAQAAEAHLLAVFHAGKLAASTGLDGLEQYVALLEEHLQAWPRGPTADQAGWRLGRLREHQGNLREAIGAFRAVSTDFASFDQVVVAVDRSYRAWLDGLDAEGTPVRELAADGAGWFESLLIDDQGRPTERFTPVQRAAALAAARLWMRNPLNDLARAESVLTAVLADSDGATQEWTTAARMLLIVCLAGSGRQSEAADLLSSLSATSPGRMLAMLEGLSRSAQTSGAEARAGLAELQQAAVQLLAPARNELSPTEQKTFDRIAAQSLGDTGRTAEALDAYRWLSRTYPNDGRIQEAYARLLLKQSDRPSREAALFKWREVETKSRSGSDRWFEAKYTLALLHYQLGNPDQAAKIIRLLEVLHPQLGGTAWKARFLELLELCQAR